MPEIWPYLDALGNPMSIPNPRAAVFWDGNQWHVATVDVTGHLQIDVLGNVNLDAALQSVATDRLQVRGEDQLFSFKGVLARTNSDTVSGAGGHIDSPSVPAGEIWVVTTAIGVDWTSPTTDHFYYNRHDGANHMFNADQRALAAGDYSKWGGHVYLDVDDVVRVTFVGSLVGDSVSVRINGYRMTVET